MTLFSTSDQGYEVEDHLFWMYRVTYEIEMHISTVISLDRLVSENSLISDLSTDMIFYHNELALTRTAYILKNQTKKDEKHSLKCLKNYLDGKQVKINNKPIKLIFDEIITFYQKHQEDIDKLINKRDAEAHEFKTKNQIEISIYNRISFDKQLDIIQEARNIISKLYVVLFNREFPSDLKYPINLYNKIYKNSIKIIASHVQPQNYN
ncbi:hypothetical protein ACL9RF_03180 [Sphingobacterium sp. Mn56C]|uniref:hypothetical protein n=1 Tax=Sphingobacterium sp. Mn56C TaxID=3395261 RepID=UPI003BE3C811